MNRRPTSRRALFIAGASLSILMVLASPLAAQEPADVLRDAALVGQFSSLIATIDMEITDRGTKNRTVELYVEQSPSEQKVLAQVVAPAFLNRMKFLTLVGPRQFDQWMATSRGVRRLADTTGDERLFDSDFTVEDFIPPDPDDYDLELQDPQTIGGERVHVIRVTPVSIDTDYAYRTIYVSQADRLLVRAEYFDTAGELVRLFELSERMTVNDRAFPEVATMSTLSAGTSTDITARNVQTNVTIPARIFNRGNLQ
ncbi:MAG: outer membrane lipoprotein-sorting protein [Spirochaetota bacterium]